MTLRVRTSVDAASACRRPRFPSSPMSARTFAADNWVTWSRSASMRASTGMSRSLTQLRSATNVYMFMPRVMCAKPVFRSITLFSSSYRERSAVPARGRSAVATRSATHAAPTRPIAERREPSAVSRHRLLVTTRRRSDPAAVDRMMRADEFQERRPALGVLVESALERRDHLGRRRHVLAVEAHGLRHVGHAGRGVIRHLPGVGIVPTAPEARAVAGVAAVVDVKRRDADLVARHRLEVAHHVAHARVAGDVDALPIGIRELRPDGSGQAEAERGHVAPAQVTPRNLRLVDRAGLVARVP